MIQKLLKLFKPKEHDRDVVFRNSITKISDVKGFIYKWNFDFPIDSWFRRRYNIPFNSERHREVSLNDILFEFYEYTIFNPAARIEEEISTVYTEEQKQKDIEAFMKEIEEEGK